jgi:energy-coupling factor transporter ATP-binding protein EcfA2
VYVASVQWESEDAVMVYPSDALPLGELTILFGANDSGKSTTLKVLAELTETLSDHRATELQNSLLLSFKDDRAAFDVMLEEIDRVGVEPEDAGGWVLRELALAGQERLLGGRENLGEELAAAPIYEIGLPGDLDGRRADNETWTVSVALSPAHDREIRPTARECLERFRGGIVNPARAIAVDPALFGPPQRSWHLGRLGCISLPLLPRALQLPAGVDTALRQLEHAVERARRAFRRWAQSVDIYLPEEDPGNPWRDATGNPDPFVISLVGALESISLDALPGFVSARYRLDFDPSTPEREPGRTRLNARISPGWDLRRYETFSEKFPVSALASGYRLWTELVIWEAVAEADAAAASLLIAAHPTLAKQRVQPDLLRQRLDAVRQSWPRLSLSNRLYPFLCAPEERSWQLQVWSAMGGRTAAPEVFDACARTLRPRLVLLDEPERHLNVKVARQAARWLQTRVGGPLGQLVLATHSPAFLACRGVSVCHVHVRRVADGVVYSSFASEDQPALDKIAREMNLDAGELFAMRAIVWVEGPMDQAVVETLCGEELRRQGAFVAAYGGVPNIGSVLKSPLARLSELRFVVLVDDLPARRLRSLRSHPDSIPSDGDEARAVARLLRNASVAERQIEVHSHGQPDIFLALDDFALAKLATHGWPGKREVLRRARAEEIPKSSLKRFVAETYGFAVNESNCRAAAELMRGRRRPAWIVRLLQSVDSPIEP